MKAVLAKLKSKWTYVILVALAGLLSGGAYSDQITDLILDFLAM
jgi:hypothetical protein